MNEVIQNILFPLTEELKMHHDLYYRGARGVTLCDGGNQGIGFPKFAYIEFNTYFNGFSNEKWKTYTDLSEVTLSLKIRGDFNLKILGVSLVNNCPQVTVFSVQKYHCPVCEEITVKFPVSEDRMLAFAIETLSECVLYGGCYSGTFLSDNQTNLALSSTTCFKEKYITRNVKILYDELLRSDDEIAKHLFIHVVDNGRSLSAKDFPEDERIFFHLNKNTGGAGGFARGMIECMHQAENITNVLLMDDDVNVQPESIRKTYYLLKHLKKEYQGCFISGAMLYMENVQMQKEDVGTVSKEGYFVPLKGREFNQEFLWDNLYNENYFPVKDACTFAAWWYCCIPMKTIRDKGLPVPIFVRGDDVEYGLRCKPGFITMNGICVWHMGFAGKFNVAMDFYQVNRDLLIDHAISGVMEEVQIIDKAKRDFRDALTRLDYDSAELCLRAIEDYLKGPDFIMQDRGEEILKSNNHLVHKMKSLEEMGNPDAGLGNPYVDGNRTFVQRVISKITMNGHRFWGGGYNKEINSIPYNSTCSPTRTYMREKLIAVNVNNRTGYMLTRDNARYKKLMCRYKEAIKIYNRTNERLVAEYRKHQKEIYSEDFWKKYLEI